MLAAVRKVIAERGQLPGACMPILHGVQEALGFIPRDAVPEIAAALNLSRAEVHGVITYYHFFRAEAPGKSVVQVCRAESCKSMGGDALLAHAEKHLGCGVHQTTKDGAFTLEPVFCLGLCSSSPAIQIGDEVHARVSQEDFNELIAEARSAA
jgi:formate dehydrogenase subunit gamma